MQIKSTSFMNNQAIPAKFTCRGNNISPPLAFAGVPANTRSLALWVHDPDAPSGDFTHWIVWNIIPETTAIGEGSLPLGAVEGTSSFGKAEYGGPCPPSGLHHYVFELFALTTALDIPSGTIIQEIRPALQPHIIAHATLTGTVRA